MARDPGSTGRGSGRPRAEQVLLARSHPLESVLPTPGPSWRRVCALLSLTGHRHPELSLHCGGVGQRPILSVLHKVPQLWSWAWCSRSQAWPQFPCSSTSAPEDGEPRPCPAARPPPHAPGLTPGAVGPAVSSLAWSAVPAFLSLETQQPPARPCLQLPRGSRPPHALSPPPTLRLRAAPAPRLEQRGNLFKKLLPTAPRPGRPMSDPETRLCYWTCNPSWI